MHVCTYARMHVSRYPGMHVCMYACMHVSRYAHIQVCMYACMQVCRYECMHVCTCARVRVCMYGCGWSTSFINRADWGIHIYILPIYLQTIQRYYTKLKLSELILLPNMSSKFCIIIIRLDAIFQINIIHIHTFQLLRQ